MHRLPEMCERLCGPNEKAKQPNQIDTAIRAQLADWIKETIALGQQASQAISDLGHTIEATVHRCRYVR